jgi:hypothetical protein
VLSFLELEKKTGVLVVSGVTSASIWIRDGSPLRVDGEIAVGPSAPEGPRSVPVTSVRPEDVEEVEADLDSFRPPPGG